jgi:hypothetical protein
MGILKNRLSEHIRNRREMNRLRKLGKSSWCPGCLEYGPWLAVFIHPLVPPEMRMKPCEYSEQMAPATKLARCMALVQYGIPIDPIIIAYNTKVAIENPEDEEAAMMYDMMMKFAKEAGAVRDESIGRHEARQSDKPTESKDEVPDGTSNDDTKPDWVSFDAGN